MLCCGGVFCVWRVSSIEYRPLEVSLERDVCTNVCASEAEKELGMTGIGRLCAGQGTSLVILPVR
jgi:hypothetical protein